MDGFEVGVSDVSIDLGRRDVTVAKHGLHRSQVCPVHEQIGRKRVTKGVWADMLGDAG